MSDRARPVALGIFRRGEELLLMDITIRSSGRRFYRPAGGGIEYGEYSDAAALRELHEELGIPCRIVRFLGVLENIFTAEDGLGHEIMMLYEMAFDSTDPYELEELLLTEDNGETFPCRWVSFAQAKEEGRPVYPDGLEALIQAAC